MGLENEKLDGSSMVAVDGCQVRGWFLVVLLHD